MDAVKAFNNELSALYEVRPPISKAKMSSITRSAIKAIKFYKHVVQSVEKFIQKCKPEYKVPGLYVIDSIVRQSRHQFGPDKDVFAPRFAKNMQITFANLFSCPPEDKGKIIRVLNLWQKNSVFTPDVIQPLFDQLADPNNPIHRDAVAASNGISTAIDKTPPSAVVKTPVLPSGNKSTGNISTDSTPNWLKSAQSQLDAANKAILELTGMQPNQQQKSGNSSLDLLHQIQHLQQLILSQNTQKQERTPAEQVVFDKKLLDFDYDDDDEENTSPHQQANNADSFNNILQNPEILRQLTALQQQMSQHQLRQQQLDIEEKMRKLKEMKQQEEEFDKHLAQTVPKLPFASECDLKQYQEPVTSTLPDLTVPPPGYPRQGHHEGGHDSEVECIDDESNERERNVEVINLLDRSPSSSPSQGSSRRRRDSRSRSRDRRRSRRSRSRSSRSRSRSNKPKRKRRSRTKSRDRDRQFDSEKDRERRKKGLPPIKRNHLSVCSTTLWVGHLSKLVQQEELSDTFGEFGDIVSIDVIPPRGCAFVCMNRRQDAARALTRLKDHKLHGKNIMLAWAPGKGVKGRDYKDYWEIDLGVSYIPWSRLSKTTDFVALEEGGALDEDTMPEHLKETILEQLRKKKDESENKFSNLVAPGFIPLPDGIPAPPVPPVLAGGIPTVMTVPPPVLGASNSPATAPNIDTSQPPPNMSPNSKNQMPVASIALPQMGSRIPVMAKPGLMMPPFPFTNLPPPLGIGVPNMMGNLPIGVPPPTMQGLLMQQQMMAIPTSAAQGFPPGAIMPPMSVAGGGPGMRDMGSGYDRHPLQGHPIGMPNHKEDDSMDLEDEGNDDDKSRSGKRSPTSGDKSNEDRTRDGSRNRDDDRRDDRSRDRDRDRDRRDRDRRDRDKDRERDYRDRDRDFRDRGRDRDRRRRSRERDDRTKSRDRDYHNRSRDRDNRREFSRSGDRERDRNREKRDKDDEGRKSSEGEVKKDGVNQWVEVPSNNEEKPSLLQRLRSIAEGNMQGDGAGPQQVFGDAIPRLNEPVIPRPGFGPRGPILDNFRPEFGPGPNFGPRNFGDRLSPGRQFDEEDMRRPGFGGRRMGGPDNDNRRFDHSGPRPLMEAHFDVPPLLPPDDMRVGPLIPDDRRGPPILMDDIRGPGPLMHPDMRGGPPDMMGPDDMIRPGPMFMDMDDPRMRFGPRGPMMGGPRGPMGPMGPGPVPLFGPRGPGPNMRMMMGRPPSGIWLDGQGPQINDNFVRPPFDDRPGGPRRGGPGSGPRFRGDRSRGDRQSRWSNEDSKDSSKSETDKKETKPEENRTDEPRDTQTPCHDERPNEENQPEIQNENQTEPQKEPEPEPEPETNEYERDTQTPCHDEPEIPDIVAEKEDSDPNPNPNPPAETEQEAEA